MRRFTIRLPHTLRQRLEALAQQEGISLNQFIVYALTQQTTLAYTMQEVPVSKIAEQRVSYKTRLRNARIATAEEIDQVLAEREVVQPEAELTPEIIKKVRKRIDAARAQMKD